MPVNPETRSEFDRGLAFFNNGSFLEAALQFERVVAANPDYYEAQLYLGKSYLGLGAYDKALTPLKRAYRLSPDAIKKETLDLVMDALMGSASSELKKGDLGQALNDAREMLSLGPESKKRKEDLSQLLTAIAMELYKNGKAREAIDRFGEAIRENPDNINAYIGLAKTLFANGEFVKALEAAEKAVSLDPESKKALGVIKEFLKK